MSVISHGYAKQTRLNKSTILPASLDLYVEKLASRRAGDTEYT